jgi:hypothetical protein
VVPLALALFGATLSPGRFAVRERWRTRTLASALGAQEPVIGEWRDGADTVTFRADASYDCRGVRCTGMGAAGEWRRSEPYGVVVRWRDGHQVTWRMVGYKGGLRLALLPLDGEVGPTEGRLYWTKVQ